MEFEVVHRPSKHPFLEAFYSKSEPLIAVLRTVTPRDPGVMVHIHKLIGRKQA